MKILYLLKFFFFGIVIFFLQNCAPVKPFGLVKQDSNIRINGNTVVPQYKRKDVTSIKEDTKIIENQINNIDKIEIMEKTIISKVPKRLRDKSINLNNFLNKSKLTLISHLGEPHSIISHGVIENFQYHLKNCNVDFFFKKKEFRIESFLLHFEIRPAKFKGYLDEKNCLKEIAK